jgi:hypothetical protein
MTDRPFPVAGNRVLIVVPFYTFGTERPAALAGFPENRIFRRKHFLFKSKFTAELS